MQKTPETIAIEGVIDQIWEIYDADNSGSLDQDETKNFIADTLGQHGLEDFSDEAFAEVFQEFDADGSNSVDKEEMVQFIKKLLGEPLEEPAQSPDVNDSATLESPDRASLGQQASPTPTQEPSQKSIQEKMPTQTKPATKKIELVPTLYFEKEIEQNLLAQEDDRKVHIDG